MSQGLAQALQRLVTVFLVTGLAAVGANLTILNGAIPDPIMASAVIAIVSAVIEAILKWLGGPVVPAEEAVALSPSEVPWWAV